MGNLLELLPNNRDSLLLSPTEKARLLSQLSNLATFTINAAKTFINNHPNKFDPHVGETLCQIRAYKTILLFRNHQQLKSLFNLEITQIHQMKANIFHLRKKYKNVIKSQKDIMSIDDFVAQCALPVSISDELTFLVSSYILTTFSQRDADNIPQAICRSTLKRVFNESNTFCTRFIRNIQRYLAEDSCAFIKALCKDMETPDDNLLLIKAFLKISENGKPVLPAFLTMRILLEHMKTTATPLVLRLHIPNLENKTCQIILCYEPDRNHFISTRQFNTTKPAIFIEGLTSFTPSDSLSKIVNQLSKYSLEQILLANMAAHPQYSGEVLNTYRNSPSPLTKYKNEKPVVSYLCDYKFWSDYAYKHGFSTVEPTLLLVKHIYAKSTVTLDIHQETLKAPPYCKIASLKKEHSTFV